MMKIFISVCSLCLLIANIGTATAGNLTAKEIRDRLAVTTEVFILDQSGNKLLSTVKYDHGGKTEPEVVGAPGFRQLNFVTSDFGSIAIQHKWTVLDDGSINVKIEEYDKVVNSDFSIEHPMATFS